MNTDVHGVHVGGVARVQLPFSYEESHTLELEPVASIEHALVKNDVYAYEPPYEQRRTFSESMRWLLSECIRGRRGLPGHSKSQAPHDSR